MKKNERGSVTLEATIFLVLFLCFYLALMSMVQIVRAQVILQYAATEAAKEIAQSTYLLTKTGIVKKSIETSNAAKEFEGRTQEMLDSVIDLANAFGKSGGSAKDLYNKGQVAGDNITDYFSSSEELVRGMTNIVKSSIADGVKDTVVEAATKGCIVKQLHYLTGEDPDTYLKKLGIVDGIEGLDFSQSSWFQTSDKEIQVIIKYRMKYDFGYLDIKEMTFLVCASTTVW